MAKKNSKISTYYELLSKYSEATKKTKKSQRAKQTNKTTIDHIKVSEKIQEDEWLNAAMSPLIFGDILKWVLMDAFPKKKKAIEEVMKNDNTTLRQRAKIAYILGTIDKDLMEDLGTIYEIRNKFAHNFKTKFADKKVRDCVRKFTTVKNKKDKVNESNSYKLYERATYGCLDKINAIENKLKKRKTS